MHENRWQIPTAHKSIALVHYMGRKQREAPLNSLCAHLILISAIPCVVCCWHAQLWNTNVHQHGKGFRIEYHAVI